MPRFPKESFHRHTRYQWIDARFTQLNSINWHVTHLGEATAGHNNQTLRKTKPRSRYDHPHTQMKTRLHRGEIVVKN